MIDGITLDFRRFSLRERRLRLRGRFPNSENGNANANVHEFSRKNLEHREN